MDFLTINVKIKTDKEISRLERIKRQLLTLDPLDDISKYALKRIEHYSPDSIKGGWDVIVDNGSIKFVHNRVKDKILWFLELGTIAHYVEPRNKKVLHWESDGKDFFSRGHVVSGIKPHLFFSRTKTDVVNYAEGKYGRRVKILI